MSLKKQKRIKKTWKKIKTIYTVDVFILFKTHMQKLQIEYNDVLIARCILASITWVDFITKFVVNKAEMSDEERENVKADFARVAGMLQSGEI